MLEMAFLKAQIFKIHVDALSLVLNPRLRMLLQTVTTHGIGKMYPLLGSFQVLSNFAIPILLTNYALSEASKS